MTDTRWLVFNKKNGLLVVLLITVLALVSWKGLQYWRQMAVHPEELFYTALENTVGARSFCYRIQTELGREDSASVITGKLIAPGNVHIQGNLQDTEFELVHIDNKTYFKESGTGKWFALTGNKMVESELFVELNPLQNFNFKDIPEIKYKGLEKVGREKLACLEFRPNVNNQFLQHRFYEFVYRVWIDPRDKFIRKAIVEAAGMEGQGDRMKIAIELWDYNKQIKISPPDSGEITLPD